MKKVYSARTVKRAAVLFCVTAMSALMLNNASGPASNSSGSRVGASFSSGTCGSCHGGGNFSPSINIQLFDGSTAVTSYTTNKSYTLRITISANNTGSNTRYGFQAVSVFSSNNNAINNWGTLPSNTTSVTVGGRTHVEQSSPLTGNVINIPWTSPSTASGSITFYAAGNVVNGNTSTSGDNGVTGSLTVTPPCTTPSISHTITNVKCKGASTGAISLSLTGGTNPFTFAWTGPNNFSSSQQNISGLRAGNYTLVITATGGCKDTTMYTVTEPATVVSVIAGVNAPICEGDTLKLTANGNGGTGTLKYSWTGPNSFMSNDQNPLIHPTTPAMSGSYTVVVTDDNNCTQNHQRTATINPFPTVDTFTYTQGTGADSNTINFMAGTITDADSTIWMFGDGNTDNTNNSNPTHTYTTDDTFTVMLIVKNGCGADTVTQKVVLEPLSINSLVPNDYKIYPNPVTNMVTIEGIEAGTSVVLYDVAGRAQYKATSTARVHRVNTEALARGNYILILKDSKGNRAQTLISKQ